MAMSWHPGWWAEFHGNAWDRLKEALRRDWEQTKNDLHLKGGLDLNQNVMDTIDQAAGNQAIPAGHRPNPPKVKRWTRKGYEWQSRAS